MLIARFETFKLLKSSWKFILFVSLFMGRAACIAQNAQRGDLETIDKKFIHDKQFLIQ